MKIGFVSLPVLGHLNPMTAVARQLQARGHDVVVISHPMLAPFVQAAGLAFAPYGSKAFPEEQVVNMIGHLSRLRGWEGLRFTCETVAAHLRVKWPEIADLVSAHGIEALVIDDYDFYAAVIPLSLRLPFAVLANALHFDYSGQTPLCVYGWPHEETAAARERNLRGVAEFTRLLVNSNVETIAKAKQAGIKANWEDPASLYADRLFISQCPRAFDFSNLAQPSRVHHTGPFHDGAGRPRAQFPWKQLTGEPLIYASLGTLQTGDPEAFRAIVRAAAELKGTQLVLSVGQVLRADELGPLPGNAVVVGHAPQLELLRRAALCVTHAGFNTTLEALTQGVPQVALPVTNDQPGVAARIAHHQTGLVCPPDARTAPRLAELMAEVLDNPLYRESAGRFRAVIQSAHGLSQAADLLEESFGTVGQPEAA